MGDVPEQVFIDAARAALGVPDDFDSPTLRVRAARDWHRRTVASAYRAGQGATPDGPRRWALPDIRAGIYRHYKGHHYLVLGYGHDSNHEGRAVVVYVGLELDGARPGPRLAVRTVEDFLAVVDPATGEVKDYPHPSPDYPLRFTYLGPSWLTDATPAADGQDGDGS